MKDAILFRGITIFAVVLALGGCGEIGIGDQFQYTSGQDEFSGAKLSEAAVDVAGDNDKNAIMTVTLRCEYPSTGEPDPFANTTLEMLLSDSKGEPKDFSGVTVKFDNSPPPKTSFLGDHDLSKYSNVSEHSYSLLTTLMLPPDERLAPLLSLVTYGTDRETTYKLIKHALNAKNMMIRYETIEGMINTNTLAIEDTNFRRVLEDCGWQKWASAYESSPTDRR